MDYKVLFAFWLVAITGPCVVSWLVGNRRGVARMRRLLLQEVPPQDPAARASALRVEPWRVSGSVFPWPAFGSVEDPVEREGLSIEERAQEAERRRRLRVALACTNTPQDEGERQEARSDRACSHLVETKPYPEAQLVTQRRIESALGIKTSSAAQPSWSASTLV